MADSAPVASAPVTAVAASSASSAELKSAAPPAAEGEGADSKPVSTTPDKTLHCKQCDKDFIFSGGEQDFYASKAYDLPHRCVDCRRARKAALRGRGRGRGRGDRGPRPSPPAGAQPGQCYAFMQGSCRYGDACRYAHN
jgi:hypothetical protein